MWKTTIFLALAGLSITGCERVVDPPGDIDQSPSLSLSGDVTVVDLGPGSGVVGRANPVNEAGEVLLNRNGQAYFWAEGVTTALGTLGGSYSVAFSINNLGHIVGYSENSQGNSEAFIWKDGVMTGLGTLGGAWSRGFHVNDLDEVIGISQTGGEVHAFLWKDGSMTDLGEDGVPLTDPLFINQIGQIIGNGGRAFFWESGVFSKIESPDGGRYTASGLNDLGQVVGRVNKGGVQTAYLWQGGVVTDIPTINTPGWALDINEVGQVVGRDGTDWFLWESGVSTNMGQGIAYAINDLGQVLVNRAGRAVIWDRGKTIELPTPDGVRSAAFDLTNSGFIFGSIGSGLASRATLWIISDLQRPREETAILRVLVQTLVDGGSLTVGRANGLRSRLEAIDRQLENGNENATANLFQAFINQVQAYINAGVLSQEEGNELIDAARNAISQLDT